jgi:hypothetical protein
VCELFADLSVIRQTIREVMMRYQTGLTFRIEPGWVLASEGWFGIAVIVQNRITRFIPRWILLYRKAGATGMGG